MARGMEVGLTFEVLWCCHVCIRVLVCWENFPRYCQLHIKYWQKLVQIHEKSAIYCCHIVSPQCSSHIQLPFYFWKVYKVNKMFLFIKLSKSLKEKHSNIWEMYIISCIRYIFMTSRDILSFSGFYESECKIFAKKLSIIYHNPGLVASKLAHIMWNRWETSFWICSDSLWNFGIHQVRWGSSGKTL